VIAGADGVLIEQKGMTFDHDLLLFFPLFPLPPRKRGRKKKENELAKIVIKGHVFLLDLGSETIAKW